MPSKPLSPSLSPPVLRAQFFMTFLPRATPTGVYPHKPVVTMVSVKDTAGNPGAQLGISLTSSLAL